MRTPAYGGPDEAERLRAAANAEHQMDGNGCWCQPRIEKGLDRAGEEFEIIVHHRFMDQPDDR